MSTAKIPFDWKKKGKDKIPQKIKPMLGVLVDKPFDQEGWIFEIKWDGYRAIAELNNENVQLYSRNQKSLNNAFQPVVEELKTLKLHAVLDGEIVILNQEGKPQFQWLQNYKKTQKGALVYYVFDILFINGHDIRNFPLLQRKQILKSAIPFAKLLHVRNSDYIPTQGRALFKAAEKNQLEGIMAKDGDSAYKMTRSREWLKVKGHLEQEVVIGGFTTPRNSRKKFGALLVGVYRDGELIYVGHVGGGFTDKLLTEIHAKLTPLSQKKCPFAHEPHPNMPVTWVKPRLVCQVSFAEWTSDDIMRQPIFKGLRDDKAAKEVHKEVQEGIEMIEPQQIENKKSAFTNLDKVFWKKHGYTKGDLIHYYDEMSKFILPYLKDRPFVLHRYPDGAEGEAFYQKDVKDKVPPWIETVRLQHEKPVDYLMVQNKKTLLYVANLASIDLHPFNVKYNRLDRPDYLIFDLDPEDISFEHVIEAAVAIHELLEKVGVKSYCKTSGATGLHLYVPLGAKYTQEQAKEFAKIVVMLVHEQLPKTTSIERSVSKRKKMVYLDFLQNRFGQTVVAPYSVRPTTHATVSTPLDWSEVKAGLDPAKFTIHTVPPRVREIGDIFKPVLRRGVNLDNALMKLMKKAHTEGENKFSS